MKKLDDESGFFIVMRILELYINKKRKAFTTFLFFCLIQPH